MDSQIPSLFEGQSLLWRVLGPSRCLLLAVKKSCDKPRQHSKKQRHHFANEVPYSQRYGFSSSHIQMWDLDRKEGWVPKNWCFQTVVLEKTLESPLTERRSDQSILKEINPEYPLEGLMLKLKLQYFGHQMRRANSLGKTLMLGKNEGRRRRGRQRMRWLDGISLSKLWEMLKDKKAWRTTVHWVSKTWTQLRDWTPTGPSRAWNLCRGHRFPVRIVNETVDTCIWEACTMTYALNLGARTRLQKPLSIGSIWEAGRGGASGESRGECEAVLFKHQRLGINLPAELE